jgi:hypothetical protein
LQPVLASFQAGNISTAILQARYLDASLRTWLSLDASLLSSLTHEAVFYDMGPLIYFTLWHTLSLNPDVTGAGTADIWLALLLEMFPESPEARIANPNPSSDRKAVSASNNPLWFLSGSMGHALASPPQAQAVLPATSAAGAVATSQGVTPALQTGLFSREANAQAQVAALSRAGFNAVIAPRIIDNIQHWAVRVPAGSDHTQMMQALRRAGFDSFLVR